MFSCCSLVESSFAARVGVLGQEAGKLCDEGRGSGGYGGPGRLTGDLLRLSDGILHGGSEQGVGGVLVGQQQGVRGSSGCEGSHQVLFTGLHQPIHAMPRPSHQQGLGQAPQLTALSCIYPVQHRSGH